MRISATVQLRYGLLAAPHHLPPGRTAHRVAQGKVAPQTGNNIGWITQLGKQVRDQAIGLRPQGLGLATGLIAPRRCLSGL